MRKLTHEEILDRQRKRSLGSRLPLCVVLNSVRSLYNVGSIFRTSDGAGVEKVWLCGITGCPPSHQISKTALGAEEHVPWEYRPLIRPLLEELKLKGYQIVMLEQMAQSIPYETFRPNAATCLVVGNEVEGVAESIVDLCDAAVDIGMDGVKNSLNVAVAFGILAYHLRACFRGNSLDGHIL